MGIVFKLKEWNDSVLRYKQKQTLNGYGTKTFSNGSIYTGQFKDDNFHGNGTVIYADGM